MSNSNQFEGKTLDDVLQEVKKGYPSAETRLVVHDRILCKKRVLQWHERSGGILARNVFGVGWCAIGGVAG
jgi:hypothetical protein